MWNLEYELTLCQPNSQEIQKRCESIVKMVEKEIFDLRKAEEKEEEQKKMAANSMSNDAGLNETVAAST